MKKIIRWLSKPLLWLVTSAIPVVIAACYGVYDGLISRSARVVDRDTGMGIGGIKVTCIDSEAGTGDSTYSFEHDGFFELYFSEGDGCQFVRFEDVDGPENGGDFADRTVEWSAELEDSEIPLDKKE